MVKWGDTGLFDLWAFKISISDSEVLLTVAILRIAPTRGAVRANKDTELVMTGVHTRVYTGYKRGF